MLPAAPAGLARPANAASGNRGFDPARAEINLHQNANRQPAKILFNAGTAVIKRDGSVAPSDRLLAILRASVAMGVIAEIGFPAATEAGVVRLHKLGATHRLRPAGCIGIRRDGGTVGAGQQNR
ncbi:MAG TPA: hypothetical protein VM325_12525 [Alphaproteobacteria bacterium]|nr:hypothetical protein [Alphaproteobacteria bacterium]